MHPTTLRQALGHLAFHPIDALVRRWNWKAAVFSSILRATIFFCANLSAGWRAATGAMLAELVFRAATSGFYGAMTANFRAVQPAWQAALAVMILLPLSSHSLEFLVHWLRHTPKLLTSIISSVSFTAISTLFNWYAMRNGAMVTGAGSQSIGSDMRAMPRLTGRFVAAPFVALWKCFRGSLAAPIENHEPQDAAFD